MPNNDQLVDDVLRGLRQTGEILYKEQLRNAFRDAPQEEVLKLYGKLKEGGERFESEWRADFLSIFPNAVATIPPIDDAEAWLFRLKQLIDRGDLASIETFLGEIGVLQMRFEPDEAFKEGANAGFKEEPQFVPFEFYPVESVIADSLRPIDYASNRGALEIARYLQSILNQLKERWKAAYRAGFAKNAEKATFSLIFTPDNEALCDGRHISIEEAIAKARDMQAVKLKVIVSVKGDPQVPMSYVNAFSAAGIKDHDICLTDETWGG